MKSSIKTILCDFISYPEITASWGITNLDVCDDNISFETNAFKYSGTLQITENEEKIFVKLVDTGIIIETIPNLVLSIIDDLVESGPKYNEKLKKWVIDSIG